MILVVQRLHPGITFGLFTNVNTATKTSTRLECQNMHTHSYCFIIKVMYTCFCYSNYFAHCAVIADILYTNDSRHV